MGPVRRLTAVTLLLAAVLSPGSGTADDGYPDRAGLIEMVEHRDALIADQESLLNTYRCMFGVDTEIVPGGCVKLGSAALPVEGWSTDIRCSRTEVTADWDGAVWTTWSVQVDARIVAAEDRPWERLWGLRMAYQVSAGGQEAGADEDRVVHVSGPTNWVPREDGGWQVVVGLGRRPVYQKRSETGFADRWYTWESDRKIPLRSEPDLGAWGCGAQVTEMTDRQGNDLLA